MQRFGPISRGIAIATLLCFAAPQAEAIELYGAGTAAAQLGDGLLVQVRGGGARHGGGGMHRGGGGMHRGGGMHHGINRGNFNRGAHVAHRGNFHGANRNVNRNCQESQRLPRGQLGQLVAAGPVLLASWRRRRGGRGAGIRRRGGCGLVGGRGSRSEPLLVLYRPEPPARLLGRLPVE